MKTVVTRIIGILLLIACPAIGLNAQTPAQGGTILKEDRSALTNVPKAEAPKPPQMIPFYNPDLTNKEIGSTANSTPNSPEELANLPVGFPVYKDTGNKEADIKAHKLAKENWIKNNPKAYQEYLDRTAPKPVRGPESPQLVTNEELPWGSADNKAAWIEKNPAAYEAFVKKGATPIREISKTEFDKMPIEKKQHIEAHPELYKIVGSK